MFLVGGALDAIPYKEILFYHNLNQTVVDFTFFLFYFFDKESGASVIMNIQQMKAFCDMQTCKIFAAKDAKILFSNAAFQTAYPDISVGDDVCSILPEQIATNKEENFTILTNLRGKAATVQATKVEDSVLYTILVGEKQEDTALMDSLSNVVRRKLMTLQMAIDQFSNEISNPQRLQANLQIIEKVHCQLQRVCDNIDHFFHLQKGDVPVRFENMDMVPFLGDFIHTINHLTEGMGYRLQFKTNLSSLELAVDKRKIEKMLLHFVANSLAAMPEGGKISLQLKKQGSDAVLYLRDTGPGMSAEDLNKAPYEKELLARPPKAGVGLGIPLAHEIIRLHQGTILIAAQEETGGARIVISLPIQTISEEEALKQEQMIYQETLGGMRAILVELSEVLESSAFSRKYLD